MYTAFCKKSGEVTHIEDRIIRFLSGTDIFNSQHNVFKFIVLICVLHSYTRPIDVRMNSFLESKNYCYGPIKNEQNITYEYLKITIHLVLLMFYILIRKVRNTFEKK